MGRGTKAVMSAIPVSAAVAFALAAIACSGCDDGGSPGGVCRVYDHVVTDEIFLHAGFDTVKIFMVAEEDYEAPVGHILKASPWLADSIIVVIHAYGETYSEDDVPKTDHYWKSDSLIVWYSYFPPNQDHIDAVFAPVSPTPPCPVREHFTIDYIEVYHPDGMEVIVDDEVR